ncbi:MBL fold metallo-hydrolase [uncultured Sphingomonas sp.]|uniref:MBL fold metallo-hydrolase n=1 Tax=uncultured Sphingomonas sp. TaxID=158754 RepID=UPI0035CB62FA
MQSRHLVTASLLAAACATVSAAQAPVIPANLDTAVVPETVADLGRGVHVITGALNNTTVVEGPRRLIVIDTQFAPRYQAIAARIAAISTKPVLYVVNTHYHYDHTGGNAQFRAHGARIFAQANVARRMAAPPVNPLTGLPDVPASPDALPTESYATSQRSMTLGGVAVRLIHPARAHTDGDTVLVLTGRDVIATGDIVGNHYPNIDVAVGGGIDGVIATTTAIIALLDDRTRVIPGHGPVLGKADVIAYRDMLRTARDRIARAKAAGMTEQQVLAANLLADLDARWKGPSPMANRFPVNVYRSLP